jgi:hypothetical protein
LTLTASQDIASSTHRDFSRGAFFLGDHQRVHLGMESGELVTLKLDARLRIHPGDVLGIDIKEEDPTAVQHTTTLAA